METLWTDMVHPTNGVPPEPAPTPTYDVHILHKDTPTDWVWHPVLMQRIIEFCNEYEEQANTKELVQNLQQSFIMDDSGMVVFGFWRDGELIGHILADRAVLYYKPIVTVHQYKLDHGIPTDTRNELLRLLKDWARDPGPKGDRPPAEFIQWLVRDKRLVPLYKRTFNADPHLLLMRMTVD